MAWDDPSVEWGAFSHVVVSSTWDSVDRPAEYLGWASRVAELSDLVNPAPVVYWGLDKVHQKELATAGVPIIPTTWVTPGDEWAAVPATEFVVKPSVSAGGRSTARYAPGDAAAGDHVRALQARGQTVMVQDYQAGVDQEGELDVVFVAGTFTHAVVKRPLLHRGDGVVERPWERLQWAGIASPGPDQRAVAELTVKAVAGLLGRVPLYARVDLVRGAAGRPLVLEVELIDPYLSLDLFPPAAIKLASAVLGAKTGAGAHDQVG